MSLQVRDRIEELKRAFEESSDPKRHQKIMAEAARKVAPQLLTLLRREAPEGSRWTEPAYSYVALNGQDVVINHGRPSRRLGLGTLESQWGSPEIEPIDGGAKFTIYSNAPQMRWLLDGTRPHPIQGHPILSFWWFKKSTVFFDTNLPIGHPGFHPRDTFIERVMNPRGENMIKAAWNEGQRNILSPLRKMMAEK